MNIINSFMLNLLNERKDWNEMEINRIRLFYFLNLTVIIKNQIIIHFNFIIIKTFICS